MCYAHATHCSTFTRMGIQMDEKHQLMAGKLYVFKRDRSRFWQCSTFIRRSLPPGKHDQGGVSPLAKEFAEDWYLELKGQEACRGRCTVRKDIQGGGGKVSPCSMRPLPHGERSPQYVEALRSISGSPFTLLRRQVLSEITPGTGSGLSHSPHTSRKDKQTGEPKRHLVIHFIRKSLYCGMY